MFRERAKNRSPGKTLRMGSLLLILLICLVACGTTAVMIRIDVLSFLSGDSITTDYGENPPIPGIGPTVTIRTPVEIIPLLDEIGSITEIRSVEISTIIRFRNDTGVARLSYEIFFHEEEADIFDTTPVVDRTVDLTPGSDITQETVTAGDERLLALFGGNEIAIAAEVVISPGGVPGNISGEVDLVGFTVMILAAGERE